MTSSCATARGVARSRDDLTSRVEADLSPWLSETHFEEVLRIRAVDTSPAKVDQPRSRHYLEIDADIRYESVLSRSYDQLLVRLAHSIGVSYRDVGLQVRFGDCIGRGDVFVRFDANANIVTSEFGRWSCFMGGRFFLFAKENLVPSVRKNEELFADERSRLSRMEVFGNAVQEAVVKYYRGLGGTVTVVTAEPVAVEVQVTRLRGVVVRGKPSFSEKIQLSLFFVPQESGFLVRYVIDGKIASGLGEPHLDEYRSMEPRYSAALSDHANAMVAALRSRFQL
jgi:hypothetical protein